MATNEQEAETAERVLRAILQLVQDPDRVGHVVPHSRDVVAVRKLAPAGWDHVAEYIHAKVLGGLGGGMDRDDFMAAVHAMWKLGGR